MAYGTIPYYSIIRETVEKVYLRAKVEKINFEICKKVVLNFKTRLLQIFCCPDVYPLKQA